MIIYESDPKKIRKNSFAFIREQVSLDHLNKLEQQIALCMIYASGDISILENLRFSEGVVELALETLDENYELLCDTEVVIAALNQKRLQHEPVCLINKANVISQGKANKKTRSMIAVDQWKNYIPGSIVLIGNEATALFRLMEKIEALDSDDEDKKPALIIATPVGFCGAEKAKEYLWENHETLGVPCITLLGTRGGGMMAASIINTFLNMKQDVFF